MEKLRGRELGKKNKPITEATAKTIEFLKREISNSGKTYSVICRESGVTYHHLWQIMAGRAIPSIDVVIRIVNALGYDLFFKLKQ